MKGLIIYPKMDTSQAREDYLDEKYFRLLARRFKKAHKQADIHLEEFDEDDSTEFLSDIGTYRNLDLFAYIGHGGRHNLYSANIGRSRGARLVEKLRAACNDGAVIILYACNAGRLNDSLLRTIYNETIDKRFRLYGHSTAGRAGNNPNKTVFPPANGAMLIDQVLGGFAGVRRFRQAWNQTLGNENDDLWATFFLLSDHELLRRACAPVLKRAVRVNRAYMNSLGWKSELDRIYRWLDVTERDEEELALGIARWQLRHFAGSPNEVDGILGKTSWKKLQPELDQEPERYLRRNLYQEPDALRAGQ